MNDQEVAVEKITDLLAEWYTDGPFATRADGTEYNTLLGSKEQVRADDEVARLLEPFPQKERDTLFDRAYNAASNRLGTKLG